MKISKHLADQITTSIYEVVKNDINLIDQNGIILSSTNPKRIGTFHQAGAEAVKTAKPVTVPKDISTEGVQRGINYPIFLDGKPIASIGITGNPRDLEQFGFLITKITEVFLKEQQLNESLVSETRTLHYIVSSLLSGEMREFGRIRELLTQYGIDINGKFCVLSAKLTDLNQEQSLRYFFSNIGCRLFLYLYPNEWVVIFDENSFASFKKQTFCSTYGEKLYAGLGSMCSLGEITKSYSYAQAARRHAQNRSLVLVDSNNISIELLLENIPADSRMLYAQNVLKSLTEKELQLLETYFSSNLSLKDTSEALFIHKNTLQYQLDRISEKSGYNPRIFKDSFILQFALICYYEQ